MRLDSLPPRLGIIGGGFIAAEMGHVFAGLGSEVTLFARSATLLRGFDHDIAERFTELFAERVDLRLGHAPTSVRRTADGIEIACGEEMTVVDELLVATGREPNTDLLDIDAGGIELPRSRPDRDRRHDGDERRGRLGHRRHRQRPAAEASRQRRGQGGVLEHRPSGRSPPAELQGGAERRVLESADRDGRPDRAASARNRAGRSSSVGATTRARPTDGRSSTRRRSPR